MSVRPTVCVIAAMARGRVIGHGNALPWHLPEDLRHFKALTMGRPIIMGRRTYESIGRPLPGRRTLIVSRNPIYTVAGCEVVPSIETALDVCAGSERVFFVGGAQLYRQVLPIAQRLYLTEIDADFPGDAFFPEFDMGVWREVDRLPQVSGSGLAFAFVTYQRH